MNFGQTMEKLPKAASESEIIHEENTEEISNQEKELAKTDMPEVNWIPSKLSSKTEINWSPRQIFQNALNDEIEIAKIRGEISPERTQEIYEAGSQIEAGFSQNPEYDAKLFCNADPAKEKEWISIFKRRAKNPNSQE